MEALRELLLEVRIPEVLIGGPLTHVVDLFLDIFRSGGHPGTLDN